MSPAKLPGHPPIEPPNGHKHTELSEKLCKKQVTELVEVSESGTGILNWAQSVLSDASYYFFYWLPRTWWNTLTSLFSLGPFGVFWALTFAIESTIVLFFSLVFRYVKLRGWHRAKTQLQ